MAGDTWQGGDLNLYVDENKKEYLLGDQKLISVELQENVAKTNQQGRSVKMNMGNNYKDKYLKYKTKYMELKRALGKN